MTNLPLGPMIRLNGEDYVLARKQAIVDAGLPGATTRVWTVEKRAIATTIDPRPDVRPGDIPGEYIITWNDWSKGVTGDHENLPGCHFFNDNVDPRIPGSLRSVAPITVITDADNDFSGDPATWIKFDNAYYLLAGKQCLVFNSSGAATLDEAITTAAKDAIEFNNEMIVAFGSGQLIYKRPTGAGATWDTSGTAYADYLARVEDHLWRALNTNEVSNIGPTDDPQDATLWSAGLTVGDDDVPITDLNALGERVVISKEDGLYLGDASAILPNVLEGLHIPRHVDNGKNTLVVGDSILYPYLGGLILYQDGTANQVGLEGSLLNVPITGDVPPGYQVCATAAEGRNIWIATKPSYFPRYNPTGCKETTDNGANYTTATTAVTDNSFSTVLDISSLDTLANGDWFLVGYSAAFYGFIANVENPNANAANLSLAVWTGAAWTSLASVIGQPLIDETKIGTVTLAQSGFIGVNTLNGSWAASTIDGVNAYWMRVLVSGALSSSVKISEIRVITDAPKSFILRGRPRQVEDVRSAPIVWDSIYSVPVTMAVPAPTSMLVSNLFPFRRGPALLIANRQHAVSIDLGLSPLESPMQGGSGNSYFAKHDAGMPTVNKQFTDITVKGRSIDASHTVDLYYRTDETASWTSLASNIATSPSRNALTAVTGYAIQLRFAFDTEASDKLTEINLVECRVRVLPTTKNYYRAMILVEDGQLHAGGGSLPSPDVQLAALEALVNTTTTLIDLVGTSKSVTVISVRQEEAFQDSQNYPIMLVSIEMAEA